MADLPPAADLSSTKDVPPVSSAPSEVEGTSEEGSVAAGEAVASSAQNQPPEQSLRSKSSAALQPGLGEALDALADRNSETEDAADNALDNVSNNASDEVLKKVANNHLEGVAVAGADLDTIDSNQSPDNNMANYQADSKMAEGASEGQYPNQDQSSDLTKTQHSPSPKLFEAESNLER